MNENEHQYETKAERTAREHQEQLDKARSEAKAGSAILGGIVGVFEDLPLDTIYGQRALTVGCEVTGCYEVHYAKQKCRRHYNREQLVEARRATIDIQNSINGGVERSAAVDALHSYSDAATG